jgi:hypothetical protein
MNQYASRYLGDSFKPLLKLKRAGVGIEDALPLVHLVRDLPEHGQRFRQVLEVGMPLRSALEQLLHSLYIMDRLSEFDELTNGRYESRRVNLRKAIKRSEAAVARVGFEATAKCQAGNAALQKKAK